MMSRTSHLTLLKMNSQMRRSNRFPRLALGSSFPLPSYRGVGKGNHAHTGVAHMRTRKALQHINLIS